MIGRLLESTGRLIPTAMLWGIGWWASANEHTVVPFLLCVIADSLFDIKTALKRKA